MATYQIHINEKTSQGKNIVALLKSATDIVSFEAPVKKRTARKNVLYKGVESGLKDVRQILDGEQPKKTLKEILREEWWSKNNNL
ncbi:MAG: hypothetical protein LBQ39_11020 [Tannerellaceae bacterium]|jgi:hypothetical protein|nr:hypothetical protein [Tannerellaceae bacterium]